MIVMDNIFIYSLYFNQFPPLRGGHASCHEMSESRRLVKLKDSFPFMPLSCGLGHRRTSALLGLHKAVASRQGQGFIPRATPHAFPLTNPHHTLLSCTILLICLTSKPLFFKQYGLIRYDIDMLLSITRLAVHAVLYRHGLIHYE